MGSKRRFKEDEIDSILINQNGSNVNKKFLSDNESLKDNLIDNELINETTQSNDNVNLIVKDLVNELIECTDNNLNNEFISSINTINKSMTTNHFNNELDDSLKINLDFNLINQDALLLNQFVDTTANFNETTAIIEHNYANVPTTSNNLFLNNNQSNKPIKGALKFNNDHQIKNKKNVKFKGVTVFYFTRSQGGSTVPSQGGSSLGMDIKHCDFKNFTLDAHQEEKRQVHREVLLRQKRYEKLYQKQQLQSKQSNQSDSDDDSLDNMSDISDSELEFNSWYFLQPIPVKQRRALLRESGVVKIDSSEKEQCKEIRFSREFCGCKCKTYCDPESCECSLNGIKCQVDRSTFPCGCSKDCCGNLSGRIEFNPLRVQNHYIHTTMRLKWESKNENQQYNDENLDHHQNNLFNHIPNSNNHLTNNQANQYELKYTTNSLQPNDIYNSLESNNLNILNCNETNLTVNDSHGDLFEYMGADSSSSCYSECTEEGLDCTLTTPTDNQTLNGLHLSPFSLLNTSSSTATTNLIPSTNNELINNQLNYDNYSQNFLTDQSFRYYSSNNLNGTQQQIDQNNLHQNSTTSNYQLINNLNYQTYYTDHLYNSSLTSVIDCYSQPNNFNKTTNDLQLQHLNTNNFNNNPQTQFEINHYTDLSQSISSSTKSSAESIIYNNLLTNTSTNLCPDLLDNSCLNGSSNDFQDLDCQINSNMNSDDSSTSRQSCTNLDNYLSSASNESPIEQDDEEDNFGEIIKKNTIVESVTA